MLSDLLLLEACLAPAGPEIAGIKLAVLSRPSHDTRTDVAIALLDVDDPRRWMDELEPEPVKFNSLGFVLEALTDGMMELYRYVVGLPAFVDEGEYNIHLTGFGVGGGRAYLLAGLLLEDGHRIASLVTFGAPKPGAGQLASKLNVLHSNRWYRNGLDIMPLIPEVPWAMGSDPFRHPGLKMQLNHEISLNTMGWHDPIAYRNALARLDPQPGVVAATGELHGVGWQF